jgi:hypothetical protein
VFLLVAGSAQALELAIPKLERVAVVGLDVVHELGDDDQVDGLAALAQRLEGELVAAPAAPAPMIIRAAAIVTALAAAFGVQGVSAHGADAGADAGMVQADERAGCELPDRD